MRTQEIEERAQDMKERARDWMESAADQASQARDVAGEYIGRNVWTSVAIAAGVGALVGFALARMTE